MKGIYQELYLNISIHALRVEGDVLGLDGATLVIISIHALRVEGDPPRKKVLCPATDFYPRPPGGGRRTAEPQTQKVVLFLSTPSGWRATAGFLLSAEAAEFLSTPSGWRATAFYNADIDKIAVISIHALRVEGDGERHAGYNIKPEISIHALRVEGDY